MSKDIMLTEQQASFYKKNGYLIVDNVFNGNEIDTLLEALNELSICASSPNYVFEEDGVIRSIFAPHKLHPEFDALYKDKRLTLPARQILENDIYLYQFKLNNKKALVGKSWEWHQDFPYWKIDDGVKEPNMISVMILLQDTKVMQGALTLIPCSHKDGVVDFEPKKKLNLDNIDPLDTKLSLGVNLKWTIKKEYLLKYFEEGEVLEINGTAGSCIFFHPLLFHSSASNLSPYDRNTAIITYNDINNLPENRENNRPDYLCERNFEVISI